MPVHVARFEHEDRIRWGVVRGPEIRPIDAELPTTADLVEYAASHHLSDASGHTLQVTDVEILSPVTRNQQLICQGANYRVHMIESGIDPDQKSFNMFFRKASSAIVPASADIVRPSHVTLLDYEVELGLVVKREMTTPVRVTKENLHQWIAGVVIVNDVSARDVQIPQMQFYKGKSYRTFAPVGPYLCLLGEGEMRVLDDLRLSLTVNGEMRQSASTSELVHKPAETLTELSGLQDLHPGDLIATGTPSGCALAVPSPTVQRVSALLPEPLRWKLFHRAQAKRPQYLKPGDVVESRITSPDGAVDLGVQHNRVLPETRGQTPLAAQVGAP
ncbi:MAG: fumarylacetoacetate hydrolase family protein [Polyangiales bacterium]